MARTTAHPPDLRTSLGGAALPLGNAVAVVLAMSGLQNLHRFPSFGAKTPKQT